TYLRCRTSRSYPERCAEQGSPENGWSCSHPPWQPGHRLLSVVYHVFAHSRPLRQVLSSRVTFVNFTMTSSLHSQSLDQVLKVGRPDTECKRTDLMKAQGELQ
ncbi:hypothetical protein BDR05DRAFT_1015065, partial [Suillus weaverae]